MGQARHWTIEAESAAGIVKQAAWLPNWKQSGQYPGPRATRKQWAWEFLRRNPDYQADYAQLQDQMKHGKAWSARAVASKYGLKTPLFDPSDQDAHSNRMFSFAHSGVRYDFGDNSWIVECVETLLLRKKDGRRQALTYLKELKSSMASHVAQREHQPAVVFDLERPLAPQIAAARGFLKHMRSELKVAAQAHRPRRENFKEYLRILDGRSSGATYPQIAAVILPIHYPQVQGTDRIKKAFDSAVALRDTGYRFI